MTRGVTIAIALVLVPAFSCGARGLEAAQSPEAPSEPDRHPGHGLIWSQPPDDDPSGALSQLAPDDPFYAECAADFIPPEDTDITHVHWWGTWLITREAPPITVTRLHSLRSGRPALDCSAAELRSCNVVIEDTNVGASSNADLYCDAWSETGPEVVYMLQIPFPGTSMTAALSNMTADLDIFLLDECDEAACLHAEDDSLSWTFAAAGTYYLVVEGFEGAESDYTLTIECADVPPLYFTIRFYDDLPIDRDRSVPGTMLYEHHTIHINEEGGTWAPGFSYWTDIPDFTVVKDERYWVSIQCVHVGYGRVVWWYWATNEAVVLEQGVMDYADAGIDRWTSLEEVTGTPLDLAVELADIETAVEAKSWGVIKSLYR